MKIVTMIRNTAIAGLLVMSGSSAFAACVSGGAGCTVLTGKVTDVYADALNISRLGSALALSPASTTLLPWVLITVDTTAPGSVTGVAAPSCVLSGANYRVGLNQVVSSASNNPSVYWNAVYSSAMTAKTAGNSVAITIEAADCKIKSIQLQP